MTPEQGKKVSLKYQPTAAATRAKFRLKVEVLESWVTAGRVPAGTYWPRGPVPLARWADEELGLEAWRSPNIAAPGGKYSDLRQRFDDAVKELAGTEDTEGSLRDRIRNLEAHRRALTGQVLNLRYLVREKEGEYSRLEDLLAISQRREADLKAQLAILKPIRRVDP